MQVGARGGAYHKRGSWIVSILEGLAEWWKVGDDAVWNSGYSFTHTLCECARKMQAFSLDDGRFFPTPERKERIFAKHPKVHAKFQREVVDSRLMSEATFWSHFGKAAAHWRGQARIEAKRAAGGGGSGGSGGSTCRSSSCGGGAAAVAANTPMAAAADSPIAANNPITLTANDYQSRCRRSMPRPRVWTAGTVVAWIPQGCSETICRHGALLDRLCPDLGRRAPGAGIMRKPADGTANAAIVTSVLRLADGVTLLTLRSTDALGHINEADKSGRGADGVEGDGEETGKSGAPARGATFVLPVLDRLHCDVDQYCLELSEYKAALERVRRSIYVVVPFAEKADVSATKRPREVLWEGRIFDDAYVYDVAYPTSKYRCLHIAWYRELKRGPDNPHGEAWVFDDEQTDNRQSPWCTEPSTTHDTWRLCHPDLAEQLPIARPTISPPHALAPAPTALTIGQNFNDLIKSVINDRLLRNEASRFFLQRVNNSMDECDYSINMRNDDTDTQTYFVDIITKANEERYENNFIRFGLDIESMIFDSMFESKSSVEYIMAHIMRADWRAVLVELGVECNVLPHDKLRGY